MAYKVFLVGAGVLRFADSCWTPVNVQFSLFNSDNNYVYLTHDGSTRYVLTCFRALLFCSAHALQSLSQKWILSIIIVTIDNFFSHAFCARAVVFITDTCVQYSKLIVLDGWLRSLFFTIRILDWCLTFETGGGSLIFNGRMSSRSSLLPKDSLSIITNHTNCGYKW